MRKTSVEVDDELVAEAMELTGARSLRKVIDNALRDLTSSYRGPEAIDYILTSEIPERVAQLRDSARR